MVSLVAGYAKKAFLKDGILTIPKGKSETKALVVITEAGDSILTPAICARSGMGMREMAPCIAVMRVILSDGGLTQRDQKVKGQKLLDTDPLPIA